MSPILNSTRDNFSTAHGNSTSMANENYHDRFAEDTSSIKAVKILIYSFVLIISLLGNSAVIYISMVARNKRMLTTINFLIANMAASDLLISTIAVQPVKLCEIMVGPRRWLIEGTVGLILCKLTYFLQDISMYVSIQSLVVIAIDRYRGIVFPFRPALITPKLCKVIIPLVWITSMGLHSPYFYIARLVSYNNTTTCNLHFDHKTTQERYVTALLVFIIILPFFIITVLYSRIMWSLRKESASRRSWSTQARQRHEENTKVFKNIFAIMIAFAFCVLPAFIYAMLFYFVWKWKMPCNMEQFGFAVHFLIYSNAAVTPVIIFVFNERYRQRLKEILQPLQFWQRDNEMNELRDGDIELNDL